MSQISQESFITKRQWKVKYLLWLVESRPVIRIKITGSSIEPKNICRYLILTLWQLLKLGRHWSLFTGILESSTTVLSCITYTSWQMSFNLTNRFFFFIVESKQTLLLSDTAYLPIYSIARERTCDHAEKPLNDTS